jgi:peroxiredoxin
MSSFYQEIKDTYDHLLKTYPEVFTDVQKFEKELSETEAFQKALRSGSQIPDFTLPNHQGKLVSIKELYQKKPLVLVFYRGQWCPFCNLQLRDLQRQLNKIENSPACLVAISPQTPNHSGATVQKLGLNFEVLSDVGGKVGKMFHLVYTIPEYLTQTYLNFGIDVEQLNDKSKVELPYPATYIINTEGLIVKHYISNYLNQRLDSQEVVEFLSAYL